MNRQRMMLAGAIVLGMLGTFIVVGYVRGVQARADAGGRMTTVFVARDAIAFGTPADSIAASVKSQKMPARYAPADAVSDLATVKGLFVVTPLAAGTTLARAAFAASPSTHGRLAVPRGHEAMSVELPMENGIESYAQPGDHVSIYATFPTSADGPETLKIASNIAILSTGSAAKTAAKGAPANDTVFVLAVTPDEAARIAFGKQIGSLWFTLVPSGQKSPSVTPATLDARRLSARGA